MPPVDDGAPFTGESEGAHSRSASDSSTKRLTGSPTTMKHYTADDPYARNSDYRIKFSEPGRANSYLPYSHHRHDPLAPVEPILIEDERANTMQTDKDRTISLQPENMTLHRPSIITRPESPPPLSFTTKKRRRGRGFCGLPWQSWLLIGILAAVAIALIWYFVWPRVPTLGLLSVDDTSSTGGWGTNALVYNTTWNVNMTADNSANWVPTRIQQISVSVIDRDTEQEFGQGQLNDFVMQPRSKSGTVAIPVNIFYQATSTSDQTYKDLYNACGPQEQSLTPQSGQVSLDVDFRVTIRISGIAWSTTTVISAPSNFACPVN